MKYCIWMMPLPGRFAISMPNAMGSNSSGSNSFTMARYNSRQATTIMSR